MTTTIYPWSDDTANLPINRSPAAVEAVNRLAKRWPPVVDGRVFKHEEEVEAVIKLREELADMKDKQSWETLNIDDVRVLLRFARARRLNVRKAAEMYRASHAWRTSVDHKLQKWKTEGYVPPPVLDKYYTGGLCGLDREGQVIYIDPLGLNHPASLLQHASQEDLLDIEMIKLESIFCRIDEAMGTDGKLRIGTTVIVDLSGLGWHHANKAGLNAFKLLSRQNDDNYPELPLKIIVTHGGWVFKSLWTIVQFFFDQNTKEKIQIHSDGAVDVLLKYIAPEALPVFLGGELPDPPSIRKGGIVPEGAYPKLEKLPTGL